MFEYDYENQLTNVYVASAWKSEFRYDAFGRKRVQKDYGWTGSAWLLTNEVRYIYDGMLVVQERNANNVALVSYTRGNDLSGSLQGAGGIGGLLARTDHATLIAQPSAAHSYYHADGNGNITALVNSNGIVVARYNYDPYGNLLGMSGSLAEANTYRFSSKEWHANAGLYYYGFRFYEPNLQRWLNRDPIQEWGGLNLFGFVENEPVAWADVDGRGKVSFFVKKCGEWGKGLWEKVTKKKAKEKLEDGTHDVLVKGDGSSKDAKNLAKDKWGDKTVRHDPHGPGQNPHYQNKNGDGQHVFYGGCTAAIECTPIGDVKDIYKFGKELKDTTKESINALDSAIDARAKLNQQLGSCDNLSDDEITNFNKYRFGGR